MLLFLSVEMVESLLKHLIETLGSYSFVLIFLCTLETEMEFLSVAVQAVFNQMLRCLILEGIL